MLRFASPFSHRPIAQFIRTTSGAAVDAESRKFHEIADRQLHSLLDDFDAIGEKCDIPGFDVVYSNGVLTLNTGIAGTYVLNKQPPNKQIWLSSPLSGPKRFEYLQSSWIDTKKVDRLDELLEREMKTIFKGIDVTITKC